MPSMEVPLINPMARKARDVLISGTGRCSQGSRCDTPPAALLASLKAMTTYRSELIRTLTARGFLHQCTDLEGLDAKAAAGPVTGYIGFDATANSLHVGSLVQIMILRWM